MNNLIFGDLPNYQVATVEYPRLDYVFRGMADNLEKVLTFEKRNSKVVESDHPLLGMLDLVGHQLDADIRFHYLTAIDHNDEWCASRGITTASKTARPYLGEFLGGGDIEFVISSVERIPSNKFVNGSYAGWATLEPLKVIATKYHDSYPWIPGEVPDKDNQWAMLTIDLPMLSIMYREWVKFHTRNKTTETRSAFIRNYVLVNSIKSLQRSKQVERLTRLKRGLDVDHVRSSSDVSTVDYEGRLVKEQYRMIKDNSMRDLNWIELMENTQIGPGVTLMNLLEPIKSAETSQNRWALALSQVPLWRFLLLHDKDSGVNQQYRERLQRFLFEMERDRGINGVRDYTAIDLVKEEFSQILALCKMR
jgi:hypothetical protein